MLNESWNAYQETTHIESSKQCHTIQYSTYMVYLFVLVQFARSSSWKIEFTSSKWPTAEIIIINEWMNNVHTLQKTTTSFEMHLFPIFVEKPVSLRSPTQFFADLFVHLVCYSSGLAAFFPPISFTLSLRNNHSMADSCSFFAFVCLYMSLCVRMCFSLRVLSLYLYFIDAVLLLFSLIAVH